ncbi:mechanosensitive ion channel family protein [Athalassotoga saccharophila]|uniref:mechanosensitive ion channel family protein n=1 Tax=Athalassotoga saccharophila TaxID=1441386 RepID=UPI001379A50B|nr:mechanosensitive ion channel family protein [Athalassotoga saccharophila]BBJ28871.1 small-conductance mechanosensitive channel [Athalassotoga saccharophila]
MATPTASTGFENTAFFYYFIRTIIAVALIIIAYYFGDYIGKVVNRAARITGKNLRAPNTTRTILKTIFIFIAIMIIIAEFNINIWPLLTSLGIAGVILGLALQTPLSNFFSGLMVIITDAVNEGDAVDINGMSGTVREVKFNHTIIDTWDGKRIHIPNSAVWSSNVTKYWPGLSRRLDMSVGVPYSLSPEKMKIIPDLLKKVMDEEPLVYKGPFIEDDPSSVVSNYVTFDGFGSSSVNFSIHFWVLRKDYFDVQIALGMDIFREFTKNGISIPYNQLNVHLDGKIKVGDKLND